MFEELFSGNLFAGVIISVIVIISYTNFTQNQQMFLVYLLLYVLMASSVVAIRVGVALFVLASFVFLEYLTNDSKKLEYITSVWKKILDYLFLLVFQFHVLFFSFSIVTLALSKRTDGWITWCVRAISIILLFICEHQTITQPFMTKTITQISRPFLERPFYSFSWNERADQRYKMLCRFEDRTFLYRKTYTIVSPEYIKMTLTLEKMRKLITSYQQQKKDDPHFTIKKELKKHGYSNPPMQLIRTVGVARGYETYKFQRKVFEIIYGYIFFSSLKKYQEDNSGDKVIHFRQYILDVYLKNVLSIVNTYRYNKLCDMFEKPNNVEFWPLEGLFVACMGLSQRKITESSIYTYGDIISEYKLNTSKIMQYARMAEKGEKIPCNA